MQDFRYLYYLTKVDGLGSVRIKKLLEHFGNSENVFGAGISEITSLDGFSNKTAEAVLRSKGSFEKFGAIYDIMKEKGEKLSIEAVCLTDDDYPSILKEIYDPPVILFYRCKAGSNAVQNLNRNSIGIVGTRKPSDYGKRMAEVFSNELSSSGINIISGFARGIDSYAHKAVLSNRRSKSITAAVFGCGVDIIYPPENKKLYEEMIESGLMISEYEIGAKPDSINFPKRNRIISGLCKGVIIIESGIEGGALITARCALDQSREVFAVPGYVTSKNSGGTNYLIKTGQAKLVENVEDVLSEICPRINGASAGGSAYNESKPVQIPELLGNEKTIFDILNSCEDPVHIDAISESAALNISDCLVTLLNLEFKGIINQLPGKRFTAVK
jgi:DNA processing protein